MNTRLDRSSLGFGLALCGGTLAAAANPACLSDEFDNPATHTNWTRIEQAESWPNDPLQTWNINTATPGSMTMIPHTVTWYQNYRGPLVFKPVTGDFAITASVRATARDGVSVPSAQFSLAGLMLRTPRAITPATWTPGGENYVFLSTGYGFANPARFQYEVKTTIDGDSQLILSDAPGPETVLQLVKIGPHVICLRQPLGGQWVVHARYRRDDMPATVQAGLVSYTDWQKVSIFDPFLHNTSTLHPPLASGVVDPNPFVPFNPDLRAEFRYARFAAPVVPAALVGADLSNPAAVSDAELLAFLGGALNVVGSCSTCPADLNGDGFVDDADFVLFASAYNTLDCADPAMLPGCPADLNVDAFVDDADFVLFAGAYNELLCP
ncbi:MAG TPA: hypothetical protein VF777_09160 [Phycisphaerales bacterium]